MSKFKTGDRVKFQPRDTTRYTAQIPPYSEGRVDHANSYHHYVLVVFDNKDLASVVFNAYGHSHMYIWNEDLILCDKDVPAEKNNTVQQNPQEDDPHKGMVQNYNGSWGWGF